MSSSEHTTPQSGCGADAAAFVLGALEPDEAERFRRHLASCAICRDEVAALQPVADVLPLAAPPLSPPKALKRRVMADVGESSRAAGTSRARTRGYGSRRFLAGASTALVAAAAVVLALVVSTSGSSGSRVVRASVAASSGSALVRVSGGSGELVVHGLPAPPPGKIYEVWLKRAGGAPQPTTALFGVTSAGAATVDVPGDLRRIKEIMVTPEPAGGSPAPTHAPVIVARLS